MLIMENSKVLATRTLKFNPADFRGDPNFAYDDEKQIDDEAINVIARARSGKANLNFYVCLQGSAPDIFFGISRADMMTCFPSTL